MLQAGSNWTTNPLQSFWTHPTQVCQGGRNWGAGGALAPPSFGDYIVLLCEFWKVSFFVIYCYR